MQSFVVKICIFVLLSTLMNTQGTIESMNSRSRLALTEQIANHVQTQLNNAFVRNQVFPKPIEQEYYPASYSVSCAPNVIPPPVVTQVLPPPPPKVSPTTNSGFIQVPVSTAKTFVSQNVPPPPPPVFVPQSVPAYNTNTNTNYISGVNNAVTGQYNSLIGHGNSLVGSSNFALGNKNSISGNTNTISANKAIVKGNMNRVIETDIDINELF